MIQVNLVMFNPNKFGGTVTYTAHLYHALRAVGCEPMIYTLGKVPARTPRDFGYGCQYLTAPPEYIAGLGGYTLVTACIGKEYEQPTLSLLRAGARVTVHDPNDLGNFTDTGWTGTRRAVVIRPNNTRLCPNATFIPHPFVRSCEGETWRLGGRPRHAMTLSRLGAIKRTKWVLEANRLLPPNRQIWLRGYDDRFFTFNAFVRSGKYPEFRQDSDLPPDERRTFAKELGQAQKLARTAYHLVDLTHIKGDGGGTQYTFLEALDAGCCLVLNRAWTDVPGTMWHPGVNCLAVGGPDELVECLSSTDNKRWQGLARAAAQILPNHDPVKVGERYLDFFKRTR